MGEPADTKTNYRVCCGEEAMCLSCRPASADEFPELEIGLGSVVYAVLYLCGQCGRPWVVLTSDYGEWWGMGAHD